MYEMYPEWGPARHRHDQPSPQQAVQTALDLRDNGGGRVDALDDPRPDDN